MIESRGLNQLLHLLIGMSLLLIPISLYLGLRPICILAGLALAYFLLDYSLLPFKHLYQTFTQWLPILFELNLCNGILILTRTFQFSRFWSLLFIGLCLFRSLILIYARLLPLNNQHRLYIERKCQLLSTFLVRESTHLFHRVSKCFQQSDDSDLEKFSLEPINTDENSHQEHDDTMQRFQRLAQDHDFSSPLVANIDCSNTSTPPIRRHHQRILQQSDMEPLSRTPITPAHTHSSKGKFLHSTMNGSYTGPMTRNRTKTGPTILTTSPVKSKPLAESTFYSLKRDEDLRST